MLEDKKTEEKKDWKKEAKDIISTIALAAVGGLVVWHAQNYDWKGHLLGPDKTPQEKEVKETPAPADTIAARDSIVVAVDKAKAAQDAFFAGMCSKLPSHQK